MVTKIKKRNGTHLPFEAQKIKNVIELAFFKNGIENQTLIQTIYEEVMAQISNSKEQEISVEEVQNIIQTTLMRNSFFTIATKFIEYRHKHKEIRNLKSGIFESIGSICKVTDRENANVGNGPASKMLQIAETASVEFAKMYLISEEATKALNDNQIYPHDLSWASIGTTTCTFIPLGKFLEKGFNTGHGFIRKPKRIRTAAQLSCIALQSNQNSQHGGQAFGWFDRDLAKSVQAEYDWQIMNILYTMAKLNFVDFSISEEEYDMISSLDYSKNKDMTLDEMCDLIYKEEEIKDTLYLKLKSNSKRLMKEINPELRENVEKLAWENTERETFQAMEATVHNLNSMHSRAGAQVPFSSLNIGTDVSREARLVAKCLLLAYEKGLGNGEQPLFPNICFKVKSGVNYEIGTPNFDLLLLSLRVSSKRLFPTFNFQDCTLNRDFPEDVPTMGCRTAVGWNIHSDIQTCESRGNLSFSSINLPNTALNTKENYNNKSQLKIVQDFNLLSDKFDVVIPTVYQENNLIKSFFLEFNKLIDLTIRQLIDRYKYQCSFTKADFPFLMDGCWMRSENLKDGETLENVLKHGTLGLGFIGLAETLKCLVGVHHGESETAFELGIQIVKFLNKKSQDARAKYKLNFAVIATPAEGLTGKLLSKDRKIFGVINGITDKEWYTNSFHVPVEYNISAFKKINIEGAFSKYCGGGSITYVELNASPLGNIEGYYQLIQAMYQSDVAYGAINFPCDRCRECNTFGFIAHGDTCPTCNSDNISRIRRITGYLAEDKNFNYAKNCEKNNRVAHM